jgi:hypothetical protein
MLPLYDPVFAEKMSHHDLPPSFQWSRKTIPISPGWPSQSWTPPAHTPPKSASPHSDHGKAPKLEGSTLDKNVSPDPMIANMLAARASSDPELKALMKEVSMSTATPEQTKAFQEHRDELGAVAHWQKARNVAEEDKRLAKHNEATTSPEDSMPIRRDSTQGQKGDNPAATRDKVESGRKEEFEETTSRRRAVARQRMEEAAAHGHKATQAQPTVIDLTRLEPKPIKQEHVKQEPNSSEEDGKTNMVEQRFVIVTQRTQASWVDKAYFACKANSKVCKLPLNSARRRTDCLTTEFTQKWQSSDCIGPERLQQVLPGRFT